MPGLAGWLGLAARLDKRNVGLPSVSLDEPGEIFRAWFKFSMMELMSLALIVVSSHLSLDSSDSTT